MNRQKWTETEIKAVEKHVLHFILQCRSWTGIRDYVRNRITALKSQASSSR